MVISRVGSRLLKSDRPVELPSFTSDQPTQMQLALAGIRITSKQDQLGSREEIRKRSRINPVGMHAGEFQCRAGQDRTTHPRKGSRNPGFYILIRPDIIACTGVLAAKPVEQARIDIVTHSPYQQTRMMCICSACNLCNRQLAGLA